MKYASIITLSLATAIVGCTSKTNDSIPSQHIDREQSYQSEQQIPDTQPPPIQAQLQSASDQAKLFFDAGMQAKSGRDYPSMLDSLMAAADLGHGEACYELARLLTEGSIVVKDVAAARLYLDRSAELGNPEALRVLAWNHLRGEYGTVDLSLGTSLMQQAAAQSVRAQRELGMLYANVYRPHLDDLVEAERLLLMAAEAGDVEAAFQLAKIKQANGDLIEAVALYEKANANGHQKAAAALKVVSEGPAAGAGLPPQPILPVIADQAPSADALYRKATAILTQSRRSLDQEASAYAMLEIAKDQGHQQAQGELFFLSGVKMLMDRKDPSWLEHEKQKILHAYGSQ
jgi:TPR repeat protein